MHQNQNLLKALSLALGALLLAACAATPNLTTPPAAVPTSSLSTPFGYPRPSGLPESSGPIPTPDPTMGTVTGVLLLQSEGAAIPVTNQQLYLADILKDAAGVERAASYDPANSPRAFTDSAGHFVFYSVKPGRYTLFLDMVVQSFILLKPGSQENIIISVSAGQTTDFGTLLYDALPIPAQTPSQSASSTSYP